MARVKQLCSKTKKSSNFLITHFKPDHRNQAIITTDLKDCVTNKHNFSKGTFRFIILSLLSHVWLCDSMAWRLPGSWYWSGLSFSPPGELPNPGIEPISAALTGRSFITKSPGKSFFFTISSIILNIYLFHDPQQSHQLALLYHQFCFLQIWFAFCITASSFNNI